MGWLDIGAGAAHGLDKLLADRLAEEHWQRKQKEEERSNLATETYRSQTLKDAEENRRLAREQAAAIAGRAAEQRTVDDTRLAYSTIPMNTIIDPAERARVVGSGALPPGRFEDATIPDRPAVESGVPPALAQNESVIKLRGTPTELATAATREATAVQRAQIDADRDAQREQTRQHQAAMEAMATRQQDTREAWGPPPMLVADPDAPGGTRWVPRSVQTLPTTGVAGPAPPALRTQAVKNEVSLDQLERLQTMYDEGAKDLIGPLSGRARVIGQQIPGVDVNEKFANFEAASKTFENAVIQAITGAAMSKEEAARIKAQIPTVNDKPEVWTAKAQQTRLNLADLNNRLRTTRGSAGAGTAPNATKKTAADYIREYGGTAP